VSDKTELLIQIDQFLEVKDTPQIMEITTTQDLNAQVLLDFFNFVKN
jgi:hypothetical protein